MRKLIYPAVSYRRASQIAFFIIVLYTFSITGCSNSAFGPTDGTTNHLEGYTDLSFSVAEAGISADIAQYYPNEVTYLDLSDPAGLRHQILLPGINAVSLEKGGAYLLSLVWNPGIAFTASSISGSIINIGNIYIVSEGLCLLPISGQAADDLDLGALSQAGDVFTSGITMSDIETGTGTSAQGIRQFASIDDSLKKLLSPDINRNGVYDSEEGISWAFRCQYVTTTRNEYYGRSDFFDELIQELENIAVTIHIDISNGDLNVAGNNTTAVLEVDTGSGYRQISYASADVDWQWSFLDIGQGYRLNLQFPIPEELDDGERAPYKGDYRLVFGDDTSFAFDNIELYNPFGSDVALPIVVWTADYGTDGFIDSIDFAWWLLSGDGVNAIYEEYFDDLVLSGNCNVSSNVGNLQLHMPAVVTGSIDVRSEGLFDNFGFEYNDIALNLVDMGPAYHSY